VDEFEHVLLGQGVVGHGGEAAEELEDDRPVEGRDLAGQVLGGGRGVGEALGLRLAAEADGVDGVG